MDCSLPGSSVHGIFQARVLEWVAIAFSSHVQLFATLWTAAYQAPLSMGSSRQEYWSGYSPEDLLQRTFPTQARARASPATFSMSALAARLLRLQPHTRGGTSAPKLKGFDV